MTEEKLFDFPRLLLTALLLFALHLVIHASKRFLISLAFVVKLSEFIFDGIKVYISSKHEFVLFVQLFINLFKLLLELLNVFLGVRVHLLKNRLRPFERINLVTRPVGRS